MTAYFVGDYVDEFTDAVVASVASRLHLMLVSKPGTGKTSIGRDVALRMVGEDRFSMIRIDPTTGTEIIFGPFDIDVALGNKKADVVIDGLPRIVDGTPYDPNCLVCLADEFPRANGALFDAYVKALDVWDNRRGTMTTGPVWIMTANFLPKDERTAAVRDRVGMTLWVDSGPMDIDAMVEAQSTAMTGGITTSGAVPTLADLERVWAAGPSPDARKAVSAAIKMVVRACETGITNSDGSPRRNFTPINNRRLTQWIQLLTKLSILYSGTDDFREVHPKALAALKWAWPCQDEAEYRDWVELMGTIADPVQSAIDAALSAAYEYFQNAKIDPQFAVNAGSELARATDTILQIVGSREDPRFIDACAMLNTQFVQAVRESSGR